jgi:hypothetical protein
MPHVASLFTSNKASLMPKAAARRQVRLTLEALESRLTPAVFLWNPGSDINWSNKLNWYDQTTAKQGDAMPGAPDTVMFEGTVAGRSQNANCRATDIAPIVTTLTVDSGYKSIIDLQSPTNLAAPSLTVTGMLTFGGGAGATIAGGSNDFGSSLITANGGMAWSGGTFDTTSVDTAQGTTSTVSAGSTKSLTNTNLRNYGTMTWSGGNVATSSAAAGPQLRNAGTFFMQADASWGTINDNAVFYNGGTLEKTTAFTSKVYLSFDNEGQFLIEGGIVEFDSVASQGALGGVGTQLTELLNGSSLKIANPLVPAYGLYNGILDGTGTIDGSLYNYGGKLQLDLEGVPTNISISNNYKQTDGLGNSGTLEIYISADGSGSSLSVGGTATLGGALNVHNYPYTGTADWTFMTYAGVNGNFATFNYDATLWTNNNNVYFFSPSEGDRSYKLVVFQA